jgi:hypothetical protein
MRRDNFNSLRERRFRYPGARGTRCAKAQAIPFQQSAPIDAPHMFAVYPKYPTTRMASTRRLGGSAVVYITSAFKAMTSLVEPADPKSGCSELLPPIRTKVRASGLAS